MIYSCHYNSPIGGITMASDGESLTGLWFDGQKHYGAGLSKNCEEKKLPMFEEAVSWLEIYFEGKEPDFMPKLMPAGSEFRLEVWRELMNIPYGQTITYGELAAILAGKRGISSMSAQAVGGAVGHNPLSILIPCHRVVGANGGLGGYAGGLERKLWLLKNEGIDMTGF